MKKIILLVSVICMTGTISIQAQSVTNDSISTLKQEKKNLVISKRLNENKLKLAKLQNTVQEKMNNVSSTTKNAQNAAADNKESADKLNDDSQDKKLARKSRKDAKNAQSAGKAGRNANEDLNDLQNDIEKLKKQIAKDEAKLGISQPAVKQ